MVYTTSQATVARGITVEITLTGSSKHAIGEITSDGVPIPQTEVDDIEVTNQDSGDWKEYKAGRKDGGECEIKANAIDGDLGQIDLSNAAKDGLTALFTVTFPSGSVLTFYGTVKTFDHVVEDEILRISSKIKVSGAPTFSATKSALTALAATGETLVPAISPFVPTTYVYTTTIAAADTEIVIVPTKADAAITVNGTTVASGGNGTVTIGAAGTDIIKEIPIVVKETGKAATVYTVIVTRPKA